MAPKPLLGASFIRQPAYGPRGEALVADYSSPPNFVITADPFGPNIADFLKMVYIQKVPIIVMICQ